MAFRDGLSAGDISALLAERVEALCRDLLPAGRREGPEWRCGSVQGEAGRSLGVHLAGPKAGIWADFASGGGGDLLDLVKAAHGLDTPAALDWARDWLGIGDGPAPAPRRPPDRRQDDGAESGPARNAEFARRIWSDARPIAGTVAETYLRGRGITCQLPPSLRFTPQLRYRPSGRDFPAMIGAVQLDQPGQDKAPVVAVHRTWLTPEGGKAPVVDPKMTLGRCKGGAVRLGAAAETIAIAEGIETALSVASAGTGLVVWAALSTSGMKAIRLPDQVRTVILCPDGDAEGAAAAERAAERLLTEGRRVLIAPTPDGVDFNDVLRGAVI